MLEKGLYGRAVRIFLARPLQFSAAGLAALTAVVLSAGLLAGPALGGIVVMALRSCRGERAGYADIMKGYESFSATFPIGLPICMMILVGGALLIVPGLILGATYSMALPAALDRGLGAREAMATARRLASADLLTFVVFFTGICLLGMGGLVVMVVGMCVSLPVAAIALTLGYLESCEMAGEAPSGACRLRPRTVARPPSCTGRAAPHTIAEWTTPAGK